MKILLAGGIIDFYVSRKKYENYKTERGKKNYVYTKLSEYLASLKGKVVDGVEIRDVSITSNNFWGIDKFCIPPDLNYSCNNEVPKLPDDSKNLPIRIFQIDLVGVIQKEHESTSELFFEVQGKNFHLDISNVKVV